MRLSRVWLLLLVAVAARATPATPALVHEQAALGIALVPLKAPVSEAAVRKGLAAFARQRGCSAEVSTSKRADYPGLSDRSLQHSPPELDASSLAAVKAAVDVVNVELHWPAKDSKRLREAYEAVIGVARSEGAVVFDRHTLSAFTVDRYRAVRVDQGWAGSVAVGMNHVMVHMVLQDDGLVMLDTGGLERFGLNDLTLLDVNRSGVNAVGNLVNAVAQRLIEGARPDAKGRLLVRVDQVAEPGLRETLVGSSFPNAKGSLVVAFGPPDVAHGARAEALELSFPELTCANRGECLDAATKHLFGYRDQASVVKHNAQVLEARARALEDLKKYQAALKQGLPQGEVLLVKARFPFDGGNEWMWVEVQTWTGDTLKGRLESEPERVKLRAGASVTVRLDDVMDYEYRLKDGTFFGNETGRVLYPDEFQPAGGGRWRSSDD